MQKAEESRLDAFPQTTIARRTEDGSTEPYSMPQLGSVYWGVEPLFMVTFNKLMKRELHDRLLQNFP